MTREEFAAEGERRQKLIAACPGHEWRQLDGWHVFACIHCPAAGGGPAFRLATLRRGEKILPFDGEPAG